MTTAVEMRNIRKFFPSSGTLAVDEVDFSVEQGEVHALVGENGAGKTTLMNILYGLVQPDVGEILVQGSPVRITHPDDALRCGIGMVHQHFKLVPSFTIAENIMLGIEPNRAGFIDSRSEAEQVRQLAASFGLPVDPNLRVKDASVGLQQRVEILKTLQRDARVLILDEPTAVLTPQEVRELYTVIRRLAGEGRAIILITHKLPEVKAVADRLTVMRRARVVGVETVQSVSIPQIASMMVGREVILNVPRATAQPGAVVLEVEQILVADNAGLPAVRGLALNVRAGEIVGIAGVSGNGQTELVEAIAGMRAIDAGRITLDGHDLSTESVRDRREAGLAHIPEDRMTTGLNLQANLDENVIVTRYQAPDYSARGWLKRGAIQAFARRLIDLFSIKSAQVGREIRMLSGGNLQKIVLGRELAGEPRCIIANQPTRGVDVGSIEFVHQALVQARDAGAAVLLVSVELDEIFALSDRILVIYEGRITAEFAAGSVNEETLGIAMAGGDAQHAPTLEAKQV